MEFRVSLAAIRQASRQMRSEDQSPASSERPITNLGTALLAYLRLARQVIPLAMSEEDLDRWWDAEARNRERLGIVDGDPNWTELTFDVEAHRMHLVGPLPAP